MPGWSALIAPVGPEEANAFYVAWIGAYLFAHLVWDAVSPRTPKFHPNRLTRKLPAVWNAATFASSVLLIVATIDPAVRATVEAAAIPLVLAGVSGLFITLGALCPYELVEGDAVTAPDGPRAQDAVADRG